MNNLRLRRMVFNKNNGIIDRLLIHEVPLNILKTLGIIFDYGRVARIGEGS